MNVGSFDHHSLFALQLYTFCDYQGLLVYSGAVVHGIRFYPSPHVTTSTHESVTHSQS